LGGWGGRSKEFVGIRGTKPRLARGIAPITKIQTNNPEEREDPGGGNQPCLQRKTLFLFIWYVLAPALPNNYGNRHRLEIFTGQIQVDLFDLN